MLGDVVTSSGRLFQITAPATGNALSPIVDSLVLGTCNPCNDAECRLVRPATAGVKLDRYDGD